MSPKVFISHASRDKGRRFVEEFARKLRQEAGVDAWVDLWEMSPGDWFHIELRLVLFQLRRVP